jgi:DNA-binding LytR/AlgR family response regulator
MMPGPMNRIDAREMKRRRADMPVLLTTGYAGSAMEYAEAEGVKVLLKPYEIRALEAALRGAMRR